MRAQTRTHTHTQKHTQTYTHTYFGKKQHVDEVCGFLPAGAGVCCARLWLPPLEQLCTAPLDDVGGEFVHYGADLAETAALGRAPVQPVPVVKQTVLPLHYQGAQLEDRRNVLTGLPV